MPNKLLCCRDVGLPNLRLLGLGEVGIPTDMG